MQLQDENPEVPKQLNDAKSSTGWTQFKYAAQCGDNIVIGVLNFQFPPSREQLTQMAHELAVLEAKTQNISWNPFNVEIRIEKL